MLNIPASFRNDNEDYITLPSIKTFMKENNIVYRSAETRKELLDRIIDFGNEKSENESVVLNWIDYVIQEGIRDVYIKATPLSEELDLITYNEQNLLAYLDQFVCKELSRHICANEYTDEFGLIDAYVTDSKIGKKIVFVYVKNLYVHTRSQSQATTRSVIYPVIAEYYLESQWLLVKAKPKTNLYTCKGDTFVLDNADQTTTEKQIFEVIKLVEQILQSEQHFGNVNNIFKNQIFKLLDRYTNTPQEIVDIMSSKKEEILTISSAIKSICDIPQKCHVPNKIEKDIDEDIRNIIEKYLSINWIDKEIFIKDRDAYPVKLSATDEEESKVEQTAALNEPLQTKALFFDNKKMLYKNKSCDGITFRWKRINIGAGQKERFRVRITVNQKGFCIFKFAEYTEKEDIENVIFSIIETSRNIN